jgi:hypothetical protein
MENCRYHREREREREREIFSFSVGKYYEAESVIKSQMEVKQL